jgi:hypothetical protein
MPQPPPPVSPVVTPQGPPPDFPGLESDQSGLGIMGQPIEAGMPEMAPPPDGSVADMPLMDEPFTPVEEAPAPGHPSVLKRPGGYGGNVGQNLAWLLGLGVLGGGSAASRAVGEYGHAYDAAEKQAEAQAYRAAQVAQKQAELAEQKANHDALLDEKQKARQQAWDLAQRKGDQADVTTLVRAWEAASKAYGMDPNTTGGQFTLGLQEAIKHSLATTKAQEAGQPPPPPPDGIMPEPTKEDAEAALYGPPEPAAPLPLYGAGSTLGLGAAKQPLIEAQARKAAADALVAEQTTGARVAHANNAPRLDEVNIAGIKTRTAATAGNEGRARKMFPLEQQKAVLANQKADLERWILRNNTIPLNNARLTHQNQVNTGTVPDGGTGGGKMLPIPVGANAAIAVKANALRGTDFGVRGCARFVTQTLRDAGVNIKGSENAGELERQIQSVKGVTAISDPSQFQPGDVIFTAGSGPSGRHVMVVASDGKIVGNPGVQGDTRVRTQGGGSNMVAYRIAAPKAAKGAKPTQTEVKARQIASSNIDPQLFDNLTKLGFAPGPQMKATLDFYTDRKLFDDDGTGKITVNRDSPVWRDFLKEQKAWREGRRKWVDGRTVIVEPKGKAAKVDNSITPQSLVADQAKQNAKKKPAKKTGKPKSRPSTGIQSVDKAFANILKK